MATWQFDLFPVPTSTLRHHFGTVPQYLTADDWDRIEWWEGRSLAGGWEEQLSRILPEGTSWSADIRSWGTEDGHRIDVFVSDGAVEGMSYRIDARYVEAELIRKLAAFTSDQDCMLVTPELKVVVPDADSLMNELRSSAAVRFVSDPKKFLDDLSNRE